MRSQSTFLAALDPQAVEEVHRDTQVYEECLEYVRAHAAGDVEGLFGPGSALWTIFGESAVSLGGMRAVMFQIAHPAIAAAGVQSSNFRADFVGRAWRTYATMSEIVFGDLRAASEAGKRLHVMHTMMRGVIPPVASASRAGERYRASDPALLFWVLATLYEASVFAFERLVRPLSVQERHRYYAEMRLLGVATGIPASHMPDTLDGFAAYWRSARERDLEVGEAARELAGFLARSPVEKLMPRWHPAPLVHVNDVWMAGLAPPELAGALGLERPGAQRRFDAICRAIRTSLRPVPVAARRTPAHHQAILRVARARGNRPPLSARSVEWINARRRLPMSLTPIKSLEGDSRAVHGDLFGESLG